MTRYLSIRYNEMQMKCQHHRLGEKSRQGIPELDWTTTEGIWRDLKPWPRQPWGADACQVTK